MGDRNIGKGDPWTFSSRFLGFHSFGSIFLSLIFLSMIFSVLQAPWQTRATRPPRYRRLPFFLTDVAQKCPLKIQVFAARFILTCWMIVLTCVALRSGRYG